MTFAEAIQHSMTLAMQADDSVVCFGLGVDDPRRIFGTTSGLLERFGSRRVFDTPTSENAVTGVAVGAALGGLRPVMVHQRLDFALLAMDQLVNSAAKWHYMFGGQKSVPLTVRLIIGRGWGQGPTHAQSLQAWFNHIPGLKVVMPSTPQDAGQLLFSSIFDNNPVLFLEHRWLHGTEGEVSDTFDCECLGSAKCLRAGTHITLVSMSYMTLEALRAAEVLVEHGISCEILDVRTVKPLDWDSIINSVSKTGRLLVLDTGTITGSVAGEIIAEVCSSLFDTLKTAPKRLGLPDHPEPTSYGMTAEFYNNSIEILRAVCEMVDLELTDPLLAAADSSECHDIPGDWFRGPF